MAIWRHAKATVALDRKLTKKPHDPKEQAHVTEATFGMDTSESKTRRDSANSGRWMTGVDAIPAYRPWASTPSSEPYDPKEQARLTEALFGPMTPEEKARLDRWDD